MVLTLKLLDGSVSKYSVNASIITIGRSQRCTIVIPHEGMSRYHCQLEYENGEFFVTDMGSTNGVLIDQFKIEPHAKVPYQPYLSLSFGVVQSLEIEVDKTAPRMQIPKTYQQKNKVIQEKVRTAADPQVSATVASKKSDLVTKIKIANKVNVIAALMLIAAIFWFFTKEKAEITSVPPSYNLEELDSDKPQNNSFYQY